MIIHGTTATKFYVRFDVAAGGLHSIDADELWVIDGDSTSSNSGIANSVSLSFNSILGYPIIDDYWFPSTEIAIACWEAKRHYLDGACGPLTLKWEITPTNITGHECKNWNDKGCSVRIGSTIFWSSTGIF